MNSISGLTEDYPIRFTRNPDKRTEEFVDEYEILENGNRYVDQLLENLIGNGEAGSNPYCLEDYILKMPFVKVGLYNGQVTGLQTLHRVNDCYLTKAYRLLNIAAYIGASDVNIVYEVTIELKCLTLKFTLNLHFRHIEIETHFSIYTNSGRDATIHQFGIENMSGMVSSIAVYKPLDWLLNNVALAIVWFFNTPIKRILSNLIKRQIQNGLSSYQFPVVDDGSPTFNETSETTRNSRNNGPF